MPDPTPQDADVLWWSAALAAYALTTVADEFPADAEDWTPEQVAAVARAGSHAANTKATYDAAVRATLLAEVRRVVEGERLHIPVTATHDASYWPEAQMENAAIDRVLAALDRVGEG